MRTRSHRARAWAFVLLSASCAGALSACAEILGVEEVHLRDGGSADADGDADAADSSDADDG